MKKPFFSVIVPAHNSERYIIKGLASIRAQTVTDYELIVVCDSCTDDTANIVARNFLKFGDKLIVTDFGMDGLARNAGIEPIPRIRRPLSDRERLSLLAAVLAMLATMAVVLVLSARAAAAYGGAL